MAVRRIQAGEAPLMELAREYGVSTNTLRSWMREWEARSRAQADAKRVATALTRKPPTRLSARERLLIHALEQSPATIIVTDVEARILYANPKFVETTGYTLEEVLGRTPRLLKSGETPPEEYRRLWQTITSGRQWRGIFHNRRKDGSLYWERAAISPVFDAQGQIAHFMAVKEDITDYMEAEAARRREAACFDAVFAALPDAVIMTDHHGRIRLANPAAEALCGIELPRGSCLLGLNLRWLDAEERGLTAEEHPLRLALEGKLGPAGLSVRLGLVPPRGGTRWTRARLTSLSLPEEDGLAALLVLTAA